MLWDFIAMGVGSFIGNVCFELLPETTEELGFGLDVSSTLFGGIVAGAVMEMLLHVHHSHHMGKREEGVHHAEDGTTAQPNKPPMDMLNSNSLHGQQASRHSKLSPPVRDQVSHHGLIADTHRAAHGYDGHVTLPSGRSGGDTLHASTVYTVHDRECVTAGASLRGQRDDIIMHSNDPVLNVAPTVSAVQMVVVTESASTSPINARSSDVAAAQRDAAALNTAPTAVSTAVSTQPNCSSIANATSQPSPDHDTETDSTSPNAPKSRLHLAYVNIIGDILHNFVDGMVIGATYMASARTGLVTTVAIVLHELPQEIADFNVLLYAGLSVRRALLLNFAVRFDSCVLSLS